ncbi:MAG TPA: hypothetical protein VJT74_09820, partial [Pyrinomonadaceae bacterium]|nr:hypothetical protein [Pyrinomonadaceae bacterium]
MRNLTKLILMMAALSLVGQNVFAQDSRGGGDGRIKPPTGSARVMSKRSERAAVGPIASVLQPNRSPLVSFRILLMTGSAADPKGKEGVAALTAAMLAEGGSRQMSYDQIQDAFYP